MNKLKFLSSLIKLIRPRLSEEQEERLKALVDIYSGTGSKKNDVETDEQETVSAETYTVESICNGAYFVIRAIFNFILSYSGFISISRLLADSKNVISFIQLGNRWNGVNVPWVTGLDRR